MNETAKARLRFSHVRAPCFWVHLLACIASGCASHSPEQCAPEQRHLPESIELPRQTLTFEPSRDDITVGCTIFSLHHSNLSKALPLEAIRVNGVRPKTPALYLKRTDKNRFELPAMKIEFSSKEIGGPLYLTVKVWFNELTNQHDSPYYENVPDRYALLSYCTQEDDDPTEVNARLGANRVASLQAFKERLAKPFAIRLNQRPLREEWGRWPLINARGLGDADLEAIEQRVRDRGERYLIAISERRENEATVAVGDHDLFQVTRTYRLKRVNRGWRVYKVDPCESGW